MPTSVQGVAYSPARQIRRTRPLLAGGSLVVIAVMALIIATMGSRSQSSECASEARIVAGRGHSILDGQAFRRATEQAYQICMKDPAAFRRIVR
jgi:hypothetical protein